MQNKVTPAYGEYYSYDRLAEASRKLHLNPAQAENEERLMNLHNHLVWHSYSPGQDEVTDAIFCAAIQSVMKEYNLQKSDLPIMVLLYLEVVERRLGYGQCDFKSRA